MKAAGEATAERRLLSKVSTAVSRNVLRVFELEEVLFLITVRQELADSAERRGRHLKNVGIVFILRIGWCGQRETKRHTERDLHYKEGKVYNF